MMTKRILATTTHPPPIDAAMTATLDLDAGVLVSTVVEVDQLSHQSAQEYTQQEIRRGCGRRRRVEPVVGVPVQLGASDKRQERMLVGSRRCVLFTGIGSIKQVVAWAVSVEMGMPWATTGPPVRDCIGLEISLINGNLAGIRS